MLTSWSLVSTPAELSMKSVLMRPPARAYSILAAWVQPSHGRWSFESMSVPAQSFVGDEIQSNSADNGWCSGKVSLYHRGT